jgi:hypothetical protein
MSTEYKFWMIMPRATIKPLGFIGMYFNDFLNIHFKCMVCMVCRLIDYRVPIKVENLRESYPRIYDIFTNSLGDWTFDVLVSVRQ